MKLYSAADLHSNNHFLTIIDEQDRRILEKRLPNDLAITLKTLEPYRTEITGIAVESTFYARSKIRRVFLDAWLQIPLFSVNPRLLSRLDRA
jgi:hypothetical protein